MFTDLMINNNTNNKKINYIKIHRQIYITWILYSRVIFTEDKHMELYIPNGLLLIIGLILIIIAIFIWCTKSLSIIAAHNDDRVYNEEKLLKWQLWVFLYQEFL